MSHTFALVFFGFSLGCAIGIAIGWLIAQKHEPATIRETQHRPPPPGWAEDRIAQEKAKQAQHIEPLTPWPRK